MQKALEGMRELKDQDLLTLIALIDWLKCSGARSVSNMKRAACQYNYCINTHNKGLSESKSDSPFL